MKRILAASLMASTLLAGIPSASAATSLPKIKWDCFLTRLVDENGPFVYFDPRASVSWYGKKLT